MFKVICVDHVGIACKDLDVSKKFYTEVLGLECTGEEPVPEQGVKPYSFLAAKLCLSFLLILPKTMMARSANTLLKTARASSTLLSVLTTSKLLSPAYRKKAAS